MRFVNSTPSDLYQIRQVCIRLATPSDLYQIRQVCIRLATPTRPNKTKQAKPACVTQVQTSKASNTVSSSRKRKVIGVEALRLYMKHSLELHIP